MSFKQVKISDLSQQYQALARTFDSPEKVDSKGNTQATDYQTKMSIYANNKEKFIKKIGVQSGTREYIDLQTATVDNGILEGWEYKAFYNKVLADVKNQVAQMSFEGEEFIDSMTASIADFTKLDFLRTNTAKNAREAKIAKMMHDIGLEYNV